MFGLESVEVWLFLSTRTFGFGYCCCRSCCRLQQRLTWGLGLGRLGGIVLVIVTVRFEEEINRDNTRGRDKTGTISLADFCLSLSSLKPQCPPR